MIINTTTSIFYTAQVAEYLDPFIGSQGRFESLPLEDQARILPQIAACAQTATTTKRFCEELQGKCRQAEGIATEPFVVKIQRMFAEQFPQEAFNPQDLLAIYIDYAADQMVQRYVLPLRIRLSEKVQEGEVDKITRAISRAIRSDFGSTLSSLPTDEQIRHNVQVRMAWGIDQRIKLLVRSELEDISLNFRIKEGAITPSFEGISEAIIRAIREKIDHSDVDTWVKSVLLKQSLYRSHLPILAFRDSVRKFIDEQIALLENTCTQIDQVPSREQIKNLLEEWAGKRRPPALEPDLYQDWMNAYVETWDNNLRGLRFDLTPQPMRRTTMTDAEKDSFLSGIEKQEI